MKAIIIIISLTIGLFGIACSELYVSGNGALKGNIHIGPICPVETVPPQPNCLPTAQTYIAYQLSVYNNPETNIIADIQPELSGKYYLKLPAGTYKIDFKDKKSLRIGGSNLPLRFRVEDGDTTNLDINIDTGIR